MKAINESVNKASIDYPYIGIGTNFDYNFLHFHKELEILFVLEGEISATVENTHYTLKTGDILIVLPDQIHSLFQNGQIKLCVLKIHPPVSLRGARLKSSYLKEGDAHHPFFAKAIERLLSEDRERRLGYTLAVNNACGEIALCILRELMLSDAEGEKKTAQSLDFFEAVHAYIEKNFKCEISLSSAALALGYSSAYFSRRFKAACGMNFFDFLTLFRLKKSIELLRDRKNSIEGVALASGYNCLRSYNRAFHKHFLQTPGTYRRLYFSEK